MPALQDLIPEAILNQNYFRYCPICIEIFEHINIQGDSGLNANIAGTDFRGNTEPELS